MTEEEKNKMEFEKALQLRQFEIDNFWKRGWFFGALLLAIVSGYMTINNSTLKVFPIVCISFLAFLISIAQSLMNRGSKYWQERWEYVTKNRETALEIDLTKTKKFNGFERYYIDACIRAKRESCITRGQRFSVSKVAILIWDILSLSTFMLWLNDIALYFDKCCIISSLLNYKIIIFHVVLLGYILLFISKGRIFEKLRESKHQMRDSSQNKSVYYTDSENYVKNKTAELSKEP